MISRRLPLRRSKDMVSHEIWSRPGQQTPALDSIGNGAQPFSAQPIQNPRDITDQQGRQEDAIGKGQPKKSENFAKRDFFLSVLGSSATKREARSYLQRFTPKLDYVASKDLSPQAKKPPLPRQCYGVNLGSFYGTRAVHESPKFVQKPAPPNEALSTSSPLHIALVTIRLPQSADDETLNGIGRTLSQLGKLGLISTVVVDCGDVPEASHHPVKSNIRDVISAQVERIVAAIDAHGMPGARMVDNIVGISTEQDDGVVLKGSIHWRTHIKYRKLLMTPLKRGIIPVIPTIGYEDDTQKITLIDADDVALALTREFAGLHPQMINFDDSIAVSDRLENLRDEMSLDRLIILDPLGGIPTVERPDGYHIFLNLEQEFDAVKKSLLMAQIVEKTSKDHSSVKPSVSDLASGNPFSRFVETEFVSPNPSLPPSRQSEIDMRSPGSKSHLKNLMLINRTLSLLPPTSSALLTTLAEAANSGKQPSQSTSIGVGTRRQRNPLIYNLLTDKPVYSSSLPAGRLGQTNPLGGENPTPSSAPIPPTTFAKRGMPVTILPDPKSRPWEPCLPGQTRLSLTDSHIDLPRLIHLINDSFNRTLDVPSYLARVDDRIAGVIIAGAYEGAAILTWELPPSIPAHDINSEATRLRMVPYLDKFAVLKRSQGAGGVADILFKAMVKDCFPHGVCWRSRRDNPVNKWYFERSSGTWKIPSTNWTMFWTTPRLGGDVARFSDYEEVCRSIEPSWADKKDVVD